MTTCTLQTGGVELFHAWERQVLALYMQAFTTGAYARHYLNEAGERGWIYQLFIEHAARCYLWTDGNALAGFLLSADSSYDRRLPFSLRDELGGEPARSIAELAIASSWRTHGLGTELVKRCVKDASVAYQNVIVRSNANADAAHRFYLRLGFEAFGTVRVSNDMITDGRRHVSIVEKQYFRYRIKDRAPEMATR